MRVPRPVLILLAIGAWLGSLWLVFQLAWLWRADYNIRRYPHDGQIGMDVFAFALLVCLGYILATLLAILILEWRRHRRR